MRFINGNLIPLRFILPIFFVFILFSFGFVSSAVRQLPYDSNFTLNDSTGSAINLNGLSFNGNNIYALQSQGWTSPIYSNNFSIADSVSGVYADGTYLYVLNYNGGYEIDRYFTNGTYIDNVSLDDTGGADFGLTSDGTYFYTTDDSAPYLDQFFANGTLISQIDLSGDIVAPLNVAYDSSDGLFYLLDSDTFAPTGAVYSYNSSDSSVVNVFNVTSLDGNEQDGFAYYDGALWFYTGSGAPYLEAYSTDGSFLYNKTLDFSVYFDGSQTPLYSLSLDSGNAYFMTDDGILWVDSVASTNPMVFTYDDTGTYMGNFSFTGTLATDFNGIVENDGKLYLTSSDDPYSTGNGLLSVFWDNGTFIQDNNLSFVPQGLAMTVPDGLFWSNDGNDIDSFYSNGTEHSSFTPAIASFSLGSQYGYLYTRPLNIATIKPYNETGGAHTGIASHYEDSTTITDNFGGSFGVYDNKMYFPLLNSGLVVVNVINDTSTPHINLITDQAFNLVNNGTEHRNAYVYANVSSYSYYSGELHPGWLDRVWLYTNASGTWKYYYMDGLDNFGLNSSVIINYTDSNFTLSNSAQAVGVNILGFDEFGTVFSSDNVFVVSRRDKQNDSIVAVMFGFWGVEDGMPLWFKILLSVAIATGFTIFLFKLVNKSQKQKGG